MDCFHSKTVPHGAIHIVCTNCEAILPAPCADDGIVVLSA
jgi:hypothetical protein